MRLRNWLLTGSGMALAILAPVGVVKAQDAGLVSAYQAFITAQASGDASATSAAEAALTEQCIANGFSSMDECVSAASGGGAISAPAEEPAAEEPAAEEPAAEAPAVEEAAPEEPAPEVVEEVVPEVVEEAVPEPEVVEEVVPEPEVLEEPVPEPEVIEEAVPEPEVIEEAVPEVVQEAAPEAVEEAVPQPDVVQETAPEPQTRPEAASETAVEPAAPETSVEPAQPTAEEPAVTEPTVETPAEQPAVEAPAEASAGDFTSALQAQVDTYNSAAATLAQGGNAEVSRMTMEAAQTEISRLCGVAGYTDAAQCLADYGLTLTEPTEAPAGSSAQPAVEGAVESTVTADPAAIQEEPSTNPVLIDQPTEEITALPEGVTQEEVAPLLDSAKDQVTLIEAGEQPTATATPEAAAANEPAGPPPTSDAEAQANVQVAPAQMTSATQEQGEVLQASPGLTVPQNVTIINEVTNNNTTVNNTTVNNTTVNNTTVNNNNAASPGGQQANAGGSGGASVSFDVNFVYQVNNQTYINNNARERDRISFDDDEDVRYEQLPRGRVRETVEREDGTLIVTIRARNGDIIRRSRITPDGREYVLAYFDDEFEDDLVEYRDPGEDLPPLRLTIPVREYVLDVEFAEEEEVEEFFSQPPVEEVRRLYSIDEVKRSARIRDSVRRLEVGGLTFDSGKATIPRDQVATLSKVAAAMADLLERNPAETFLIEGHTDAVGTDISNLSLSDQRASTVARILTDFYDIPPENLATQGYGERYLKIRTEDDERANRRVTIRRITPLVTPLVAGN